MPVALQEDAPVRGRSGYIETVRVCYGILASRLSVAFIDDESRVAPAGGVARVVASGVKVDFRYTFV
jgi:hypothetical protein